jgi:RHS repeat-associated protein
MDQYPLLQFYWCDNESLVPGTRWIKVNGVLQTSSFDYTTQDPSGNCAVRARSQTTSVALNVGSNLIEMYICDDDDLGPYCWYGTQYVTRLAGPRPVVSLAPYNATNQDLARCAFDCFAATYAQSTVPYYSMDTPRGVTLVYHGDHVNPKPFVQVNVTHGGDGSNLPTAYRLKVMKGATNITFLNGETTLRFTTSTATERLAGQFDAAANGMSADSVYSITVVVGAEYAAGVEEVTAATTLIVVNENDSPIAKGWTLAGVQRLVTTAGGALITDGTGSAVYFTGGGTTYYAPAGEFTRLTASGTGTGRTYTRAYPDSTRVTFNYLGRMTRTQDPFGNTDSLSYDGSNRPFRVWDPVGKSITLTYGANGLAGIGNWDGRTTNVTVDGNRLLTTITDPDYISTQFGYDASQRLLTVTNRGGATTTLGYHNTAGKLTSVTAPAVTLFTGQQVQPATTFAPWQIVGVPYNATTPTPFTAARADTVRAAVTDAGGHTVRFTVSSFGQPLRTTGQPGDTVTVTYNANGQSTAVADRLGVTSYYQYDATGFVTMAAVGSLATYFRNGGWGKADSTWGVGVAQRAFLGTNGRVDSVRVASQYTTRYSYDSRGRVLSVYSPTNQLEVRHFYNGVLSNLWSDTIPGGRVVYHETDSYGRHHFEQLPGLPLRITTFDIMNRVTQYEDGVNPTATVFHHDALRDTSVTDPKGQTWRTHFNALGWVTSRVDAAGQRDSLAYDAEGLLRRVINRRGQVIELTYDALHRQLARTGANTTPDTTTYSSDGRVITTANAVTQDVTYLNSYLQPDSVKTVYRTAANATFWRRYSYGLSTGLLQSVTASGPGGSLVSRGYTYRTDRGTLESIALGDYEVTSLVPNGELLPATTIFPGQDTLKRGYVTANDLERLTLDGYRYPAPLDDMYHRDPLGRLDQARRQDNTMRAFAYDSLGHLRRVQFGTADYQACVENADLGWQCTETIDSTTRYTYDAVGNRDSTITASATLTGTYGTGDRIQTFAGCTYTSDADGNVTSRACPGQQTIFFGWGAEGRLVSDSIAGAARVSYSYDAAGRVVRRAINGVPVSYFLWDGPNLLAELDGNAQSVETQYSYYPGLDQLHALIVTDTMHYAQQDAEGNVRYLGTNIWNGFRTYTYDEWGRLLGAWDPDADTVNLARWKGALYLAPEVGLYYMRARWYEPRTGRFLSEDPAGLEGGLNPYTFGGGDPVNAADPDGRCWLTWGFGEGDSYYEKSFWTDDSRYCPGETRRATAFDLHQQELFEATAERTCGWNPSVLCEDSPAPLPPPTPRSRRAFAAVYGAHACAVSTGGVCAGWGRIVGRDGRQRYNQGGIHAGWNVSAQLVVGFVTSPEVITGRSREVCVGVFIFSGCYSRSGDEWGLSFGIGPSLTPATVHSGYSWGRLF